MRASNPARVILVILVAMATAVSGSWLAEAAEPPVPSVVDRIVASAVNAEGDFVVEIDISDIDIDPDALRDALFEANFQITSAERLSDVILEGIQNRDFAPPGYAPPLASSFPSFEGTLDWDADSVQMTVFEEDVRTELYGWVISIIAGTLATLGGVIAGAVCTAALITNPAAVAAVCPVVQSASIAFLWTLISGALGKGTLFSGEVWASALAAGIVGAAGATLYVRYFADWIAKFAAISFRTIAASVSLSVRNLGYADTARILVGTAREVALLLPRRAARFAREAGWSAAERATRVLPLGDSITAGCCGLNGNGYRERLESSVDPFPGEFDFVGGQRDGTMADPDNEGHSGWTIDQISGVTDRALEQYRPNVVTLLAGTNDLGSDGDAAGAPARLAALVDKILAYDPKTYVLLARVPTSSEPARQARTTIFNDEIESIADDRDHVVSVDTSDIGLADMGDPLHPNASGHAELGEGFADMLSLLLYADVLAPPGPGTGPVTTCTPGDNGWKPIGEVAGGVGQPGEATRFADLDGDGDVDYLTVEPGGRIEAWINNGPDGKGGWKWDRRGEIANGAGGTDQNISFPDLDGDARADFAITDQDGGRVTAYLNGGRAADGWVWYDKGEIAAGVGNDPDKSRIVFADVTGDGRDDYLQVALSGGAVNLWLNQGSGSSIGWWDRKSIALGVGVNSGTEKVTFARMTCGSTRDDYLKESKGFGQLDQWTNGGGTGEGDWTWFQENSVASGAGGPGRYVHLGDFDGDGLDDYIVVAPNGATEVLLNKGGDS